MCWVGGDEQCPCTAFRRNDCDRSGKRGLAYTTFATEEENPTIERRVAHRSTTAETTFRRLVHAHAKMPLVKFLNEIGI
jgi:hypothetical protein